MPDFANQILRNSALLMLLVAATFALLIASCAGRRWDSEGHKHPSADSIAKSNTHTHDRPNSHTHTGTNANSGSRSHCHTYTDPIAHADTYF